MLGLHFCWKFRFPALEPPPPFDDLIFFNITLYHCTFRVMIFERSMILCLVVYNFVLVERNFLLFVIPYIIIRYSLRKKVDIMDYISVKAASEKWGISERRIQKLILGKLMP